MRVVVVYEDNTDHTRSVTEFMHDFEYQTGHVLEIMDPGTEAGTHFCDTYGIVEYPTIIALSDDSVMQQCWRGMPLPTISEVSYYAQ
jgi:hypothetical protein